MADRVLASDLDGTLVPFADNAQNEADLRELSRLVRDHRVALVFVTGRHLASVQEGIQQHSLPHPEWVICDVGTSIYRMDPGLEPAPVEAYSRRISSLTARLPVAELRESLHHIRGLEPQEDVKQTPFKLSYYSDGGDVESLVARIRTVLRQLDAPYATTHCIDPYSGAGLIDLLPERVSKASALRWWVEHTGQDPKSIVFAGDSGNDLSVFVEGYRTILVGNTEPAVAREAYDAHAGFGWANRLFLANQGATSGVLEGCRWFELFPDANPRRPDRLGATPVSADRTHFRVWSPKRRSVAVELNGRGGPKRHELQRHASGYFSGTVAGVSPGSRYRLSLDHQLSRPDPASRFQPDGVHGQSQVVSHQAFPWQDAAWPGVDKTDLIIYELHVGTFTREGTFRSAMERIAHLVDLGVTAVELMPVAQSPGQWNWGYDGVNLFSVRNSYGTPDDFKAFVDACHRAGLAVILDVVYNHLGPEGNYLSDFAPYFSQKHGTPWGAAFDYDGCNSEAVRRFVVENALHWLEAFHLDGLRLDAVHFMFDDSEHTILDELRLKVRAFASQADRQIHLIAESNVYDDALVRGSAEKPPYDAIWCDDIMHSVYSHGVAGISLTRRPYRGALDLQEALQHGFIYEGPTLSRVESGRRRQQPAPISRDYLSSLVVALQTHDSVGNHPHGKRIHHLISTDFQKAAAALVLLYPAIPLIFMGEEHASTSVFPFFVDFEDQALRKRVDRGRAAEYPQHQWRGAILPSDPTAFRRAKCDDPALHDPSVAQWYRALIRLRQDLKRQGVLRPAHLQASYDEQTMCFALRYDPEDGPPYTVLVRLESSAGGNSTVELPLSGELIMDSTGDAAGRTSLRLNPNHAIVMRG